GGPARAGARLRLRAAQAAKGRSWTRVSRRLQAAARRRRRPDPRDGLRLLARPERCAEADCCRGGRRSRPRLTLRRGRSCWELGSRPPLHLTWRLALRTDPAAVARARSDRRLQVLPPRRARGIAAGRSPLEGLRIPDRNDVSRGAKGLS